MTPDTQVLGTVFNIQKYSVHDGPGIRTTVFLKGCPLRCLWCCNPESQSPRPEPAHVIERCFACGRCAKACPEQAITLAPDGLHIQRDTCSTCSFFSGEQSADALKAPCAGVCPDRALVVYGSRKTVREVLAEVEKDALFYSRSGGGMTVSGGEPLMQPDFLMALLRESRKRRIRTAIETSAFASESVFLAVMPLLDTLLVDIKHPDSDRHREVTGVPNEPILRNIRAAREHFPSLPITIRTPVIPGINDSEEVIREIAAFAHELGTNYELLPYHRLGEAKYTALGRRFPMEGATLDEALFARLQTIASGI